MCINKYADSVPSLHVKKNPDVRIAHFLVGITPENEGIWLVGCPIHPELFNPFTS